MWPKWLEQEQAGIGWYKPSCCALTLLWT